MSILVATSHKTSETAKAVGGNASSRSLLVSFKGDRSGDVAVLFGLMAMGLFLMTGAAVDIGRWINARNDTVQALDAAVLAGGRSLQLNNDHALAVEVAQRYYLANTKDRLGLASDDITFVVTDQGLGFTAQGSAYINTPFMGLAGVEQLPLLNITGTEYSKAKLAVGGNAKMNIEIGMMLDVSGSMSGTKLTDMKTAAKDLIDIIVWDDQSEFTSKVAIAPFSADVRLPNDLLLAARDPAMIGPVTGPGYACKKKGNWTTCQNTYYRRDCVVERKGDEKYTGVGPGPGKYVMPLFTKSNDGCSTPSNAAVKPLSNDKTALKNMIDGISLGGGTAGHLGTAWAWYLISPDWASVLPAASQPRSYTAPNTKKIAILMTDGEYNTEYSEWGVEANTTGAPTPNSFANALSKHQAVDLCTGMKAKDIEVYTVGFDLGGNSTAINTLNSCATSPGHAYLAEDGEELKQAFRDIALKISTLYISR